MIVFKRSGLFCGGRGASPETPPAGRGPPALLRCGVSGRAGEPAVAAGRLRSAPRRAAPLRRPRGGQWAEGPLPEVSSGGRGGGGRAPASSSAGRAAVERVGAPQFPAPPPPLRRDRGTRRPLPLLAESLPRNPRRRVSSSLPLSGASVGGCPAAASWSASSPLSESPPCRVAAGAGRRGEGGEGGFFSRLIPSPFFFNGGHRDKSRGPPAALPLAGAPSRAPAQRWPPSLLGEGGCGGAARPPGASWALESRPPSSLGGRHLAAAPGRGAAGCAAGLGAAAAGPLVRIPPHPSPPRPAAAGPRWGGGVAVPLIPPVAPIRSWASPRGWTGGVSHAPIAAGQPGAKVRAQTVPPAKKSLACAQYPLGPLHRGANSVLRLWEPF